MLSLEWRYEAGVVVAAAADDDDNACTLLSLFHSFLALNSKGASVWLKIAYRMQCKVPVFADKNASFLISMIWSNEIIRYSEISVKPMPKLSVIAKFDE